jgi:hypothetical protein
MALLVSVLSNAGLSPISLFSTLTSDVATGKAAIEAAGFQIFATPITNAMAESMTRVTSITGTGQFNGNLLTTSFKLPNKLYGTFFANGTRQFSIIWTFTDGTNTIDSFMSKSNSTNIGAFYTFEVVNSSGVTILGPTTTPAKWCFSDGASYNVNNSQFSADDGVWGAAQSQLNPNQGFGNSFRLSGTTTGYGFENFDSGDSAANVLYSNSVSVASGTIFAYIYF